jgi:uncharacterized protein DUF1353
MDRPSELGRWGFLSYALLEPLKGELIRLARPLPYRSRRYGKTYIIPAGFVFDGASEPRGLWAFLPSKTDIAAEGALHDWLYRVGPSIGVDRSTADYLLWEAMELSGSGSSFGRWKVWAGVRAGGWVAWNGWRELGLKKDSPLALTVYKSDGTEWRRG